MPETDRELLQRYLAERSEAAFRKLVERHLPLVHSTARRVTANAEAAQDVAQTVFLKLVQRASRISPDSPLTAWLHRVTHNTSVDYVRSEVRRQRREQSAAALSAMNTDDQDWNDLAPLIDGAIDSLPRKDRSLVLLRFYEKKTHPEIALELGIKEDAARMRTNRALDKLRAILRKRGITTTAAVLAAALPAHAVTAPPAALATSISAVAATTTTATVVTSVLALAKTHLVAIGAVAIALPILGLQQSHVSRLKKENESLRAAGLGSATARGASRAGLSGRSGRGTRGKTVAPADLGKILAQSDPMRRIRGILAYVDGLAPEDFPAALEELRKRAPEWDPEGKILTHILLTRWAQEDPDGAFANLGDLGFKSTGGSPTSILAGLAAQDPERAAQWLADPENSLIHYPWMKRILAGTIAKEWVRQDAGAALAWAQSLPPGGQRHGAYDGVLESLAGTDPQRASRLTMDLEPGMARTEIVGGVAEAWARSAPEAALAWAQSLNGTEQSEATREALRGWSENHPSAAAAFLDGLKGQRGVDRYLDAVAENWAPRAPAEAAAWVSSQPEGEGKSAAMGKVMWNWTTQDPDGAATWLGDQPAGPARDAGISGLAKAGFDFDPAGSLAWAATISNEEVRESAVAYGLEEWIKRDSEAARQWASENGIDLPGVEESANR